MTKVKVLYEIIKTCSDCPYCEYNGHYSKSKDSGHDCNLANRRIINDWDWNDKNNPGRLNKRTNGRLPIPDWCPLPDTDEKD